MSEAYTHYVEGTDYSIVPVESNEAGWDVRIMTGEYVETVLRFGNIRIDGKGEEARMKYDFVVQYSPIDGLNSDEDVALQEYAGDILLSVIKQGMEDNALVIDDVDQ